MLGIKTNELVVVKEILESLVNTVLEHEERPTLDGPLCLIQEVLVIESEWLLSKFDLTLTDHLVLPVVVDYHVS